LMSCFGLPKRFQHKKRRIPEPVSVFRLMQKLIVCSPPRFHFGNVARCVQSEFCLTLAGAADSLRFILGKASFNGALLSRESCRLAGRFMFSEVN
jgi:hypothetical protein